MIDSFGIRFRWYYTSDTVVKEVTIDEVLSVSAYMLFYDRGTGPSRQPMWTSGWSSQQQVDKRSTIMTQIKWFFKKTNASKVAR